MALGNLAACFLLLLSAAATLANHDDHQIVHLVFSNHLDVGFTDMDNEVISLYFHTHFPNAIRLAEAGRRNATATASGDSFSYLTHSWLVSLFLDCPPGMGVRCPNATEVAAFEAAARRGDVTWHAAPFNLQYEMADAPLLHAGVELAHTLDARFGLPKKMTASLRDVPGLTRGAVPILAAAGVAALTVGVNGFSAPPGVPKATPFIWRDVASGAQLLAMWHPGGYGGWTRGVQVDGARDCVTHPRFRHVLCVSWRQDNLGPPESVDEVAAIFKTLREEFPGAEVFASTLDAYTAELVKAAPALDLPVVTGEIGDTWVYGVQSDPLKVADYRAALRARRACVASPDCNSASPAFANFTRLLLKLPEHTWGLSFNAYVDHDNYTNACLHERLARPEQYPGYAKVVQSWLRQRRYLRWALDALPPHHAVRASFDADAAARAEHAAADGAALLAQGSRELPLLQRATLRRAGGGALSFRTPFWEFEVDAQSGGLRRLARLYDGGARRGVDWVGGGGGNGGGCDTVVASSPSPSPPRWRTLLARLAAALGLGGSADVAAIPSCAAATTTPPPSLFGALQYDLYNAQSYEFVWQHYAYMFPVWDGDFGRANLSATSNATARVTARLERAYVRHERGGGVLLHLRLRFPLPLVRDAGAPAAAWLVLHAPGDSAALRATMAYQNKTATRLPEALWLRFRPAPGVVEPSSWRMSKLGSSIAPQEVIINGSHSIHAVDDERSVSVSSASRAERLAVSSLDAALLAAGAPIAMPNPSEGPAMEEGVSYNLISTLWGTNYPIWTPLSSPSTPGTDASLAFRFVITADEEEEQAAAAVAASR